MKEARLLCGRGNDVVHLQLILRDSYSFFSILEGESSRPVGPVSKALCPEGLPIHSFAK